MKDEAQYSLKLGYTFLGYLFEDDPSLKYEFVSYEEGRKLLEEEEAQKIYDIHIKLMELAGFPLSKEQSILKVYF